jgi:hypothetical protein
MPRKAEQPERDPLSELSTLEKLRVAPMNEAEHLSGLSQETIRRHHSDLIIDLSPRRQGMRVKDALMLRDKKSA